MNKTTDYKNIVREFFPFYIGRDSRSSIAFVNLLKKKASSEALITFFQGFSLKGQLEIDDGLIFSEKQILYKNAYENNFSHELLIIGCYSNYDPILLDCKTSCVFRGRCEEGYLLEQISSFNLFLSNVYDSYINSDYLVPNVFNASLQKCIEAYTLNSTLRYKRINERFSNWLKSKKIPMDIYKLFEWFMPVTNYPVGIGDIYSYSSIIDINEMWYESLLSGFLIVGTCIDGDFIVIDLKTDSHEVGYVTHDEIDEGCDFNKFYIMVSPSFEAFFHDSNFLRYLPDDYYQAKEFL